MTQQLIRRETGEIIDVQAPADLHILDTFSPDPITTEDPRLDAIATVSAGRRAEGKDGHAGLPQVSRDGTIYLHDPKGRAPHLKAALERTGGKLLTIAFPFNNTAAFVQSRFTEYSSTHLLAHGDEYRITTINPTNGVRHVYELETDPDGYNAARKRCKVSISIYFALAEWASGGPQINWDDGLSLYRLRTTSRNSIRNLDAALRHVSSFTGGRIAGVPFDTELDYRDVAGPDGSRRNVPVWTFRMAPPGGLTSRTFAPRLREALAEGQRLLVEPPRAEDEDIAEADFREMGDDESLAISDDEAALVARGGRCDARVWEAQWFAAVRGTPYDSDEARADFIHQYSHGAADSLKYYLDHASEAEASALLAAVVKQVEDVRVAEMRARVEDKVPTGKAVLALTSLDDDGYGVRPPVDDGPLFDPADDVLEEMIEEQEPPQPAVMPTAKDIEDYARGLALAQRLELDVAPYETSGAETRKELFAKAGLLKTATDRRTAELAKTAR